MLESEIASGLHGVLHGTPNANCEGDLQHRVQQSSKSRWTWATYVVDQGSSSMGKSAIGRPSPRCLDRLKMLLRWGEKRNEDAAKIGDSRYCHKTIPMRTGDLYTEISLA